MAGSNGGAGNLSPSRPILLQCRRLIVVKIFEINSSTWVGFVKHRHVSCLFLKCIGSCNFFPAAKPSTDDLRPFVGVLPDAIRTIPPKGPPASPPPQHPCPGALAMVIPQTHQGWPRTRHLATPLGPRPPPSFLRNGKDQPTASYRDPPSIFISGFMEPGKAGDPSASLGSPASSFCAGPAPPPATPLRKGLI